MSGDTWSLQTVKVTSTWWRWWWQQLPSARNTQIGHETHMGHLTYIFPQLYQEDGSITLISRGQKWLLEAQQTADDKTQLCTALQRTMPRRRGLSIDGRASQGHMCCMRWPLWFCHSFLLIRKVWMFVCTYSCACESRCCVCMCEHVCMSMYVDCEHVL